MKKVACRMILFLGLSFYLLKVVEGSSFTIIQKILKVEGDSVEKKIKVGNRDKVKIKGNNNRITVEGSFAALEIEGTDNVIVLSKVIKIDIDGINNVVTSYIVDHVEIEGQKNAVHYKGSSNRNGKAKVDTQGIDNKVKRL